MLNQLENLISIIDYIEEHLSENMNLTTIANAVHYSKYHLHRMFTETVGISIHDYVQRRKLTEAAKLLVFSERSILEISLIAGYESQQAFSTIFKKMYKKSPYQYRTEKVFYPLQLKYDFKPDITPKTFQKEEIMFATVSDIPMWLTLVSLIIDGFPNLQEEEYIHELTKCIQEKRAYLLKDKNEAIAIMIFNPDIGNIEFFGVHPLYRHNGITRLFLDKIINEFTLQKEISITTFREGDKADTGYRQTYQQLGFAEGELLIEYGYPTQKLIFTPSGGNRHE